VRTGERIQDFPATLEDGREVRFFDLLAEGPVVLFFYPKAFTPGCTAEACHFRDLAAEFAAAGAQRIGVSRDAAGAQSSFREEHHLDFPLIADQDGSIARRFGAKRPGILWSKRQTFVIDTDGTVGRIISSERNMQVHADEALEALADLRRQPVADLRIEVSLDEEVSADRD